MLLNKEEIIVSSKNKTQGVYFLFLNDEIIYIGSSYDCESRVKSHKRKGDIVFSVYSIFEMNQNTRDEVFYKEAEYINKFKPKYNSKSPKKKKEQALFIKTKNETDLCKIILKKYGTIQKFANEMGWSHQRARYIATKDPSEMNLKKLDKICEILNCKKKDLI